MRAGRALVLVLHSGNFKANSRDSSRRIGKHRPSGAQPHLDAAVAIFEQLFYLSCEIFRQILIVVDNYRTADSLDYSGIVELLHVAMKRIWHKDRGTSGQGDVRDGAAAGAGNNHGCARQGIGYVLDKRDDLRLNGHFLVLRPQQLHIRIPTLVKERPLYNTFSPDFESPNYSKIEAMRASRAA